MSIHPVKDELYPQDVVGAYNYYDDTYTQWETVTSENMITGTGGSPSEE